MGWSGSLTTSSAVGASITWTPNSPESTDPKTKYIEVQSYAGNYSVSSFTAPKRGIYQFKLKGSGGAQLTQTKSSGKDSGSSGGTGGSTTGYLLLEAGQKVYVGAGGVCRAAFVSAADSDSLAEISKANLYFVAGAGGSGGAYHDNWNGTGYNCVTSAGGKGGGSSGAAGSTPSRDDTGPGGGGTQSAGGAAGTHGGKAGAYGKGANGTSHTDNEHFQYSGFGGRGGDGYYGGGSGGADSYSGGASASGGGGGSGYVKTASFTHGGVTYKSTTSQGGGASSNNAGSVVVTYYALADLPIYFNGKRLQEIFFNGEKVNSLIYGGKTIFARRCMEWLSKRVVRSFGFRRATPAL